jgi:hypothetical protein
VYGQSIPFGQREMEIDLADIEKGSALETVIEVEFQNHPLGQYRVLSARLSYDDSITGQRETTDIDCVIEFTAEASKVSGAPHPRLSQAVSMSLAGRAVEKTMMGLKSGQITAAMAIQDLQKTQMLLQGEGRIEEAQQVAQAVRDLQSGNAQQVEKTLIGTVISLDQGKKSQTP